MAVPENDESGESIGWKSGLDLSEDLIAGIHHTLNNRMAALSAVAQVLEADLPASHPLAGAMTAELQRLEGTVSLLSLLTGGEEGEPVLLEGVVAELTKLFAMHHSLRDQRLEVKLPPNLYPLWIAPAALRRALMVMLAIGGRAAREGENVVELTAEGDARIVEVCVLSVGARRNGSREGEDIGMAGGAAPGAGALLAPGGGSVEEVEMDGGWALRAELLTLPEARSREAAGAL